MRIKMNCACGAGIEIDESHYASDVKDQANKWHEFHKTCSPSIDHFKRQLFDEVTEHALKVYEQASRRAGGEV
jgi:hypothetical protein